MSNLVEHARSELAIAGVEEDVRPSILAAVESFVSYGHSGGSASIVIPMLNDLLSFRNIAPLTDNPAEWQNLTGFSSDPAWQSTRRADAFSNDGGKTYYCLDEPKKRNWYGKKVRRMHRSQPA